jgi:two-component system NtrC family sensor kinase
VQLEPTKSGKGSVGALRILLAAAVLVPFVLFAVASWLDKQVLLDEAEHRSIKTSIILQQQAAATMEIYELIFLRVEDFLAANSGAPDRDQLHEFLKKLDDDIGQIEAVFVVDQDGNVIGHSRFSGSQPASAADRDYFLALKNSSLKTVIGAPTLGRLGGKPRLNMAHRLQDKAGRFTGAIVVSVADTYFSSFHRVIGDSLADVVLLIRNDGAILAGSPMLDASFKSDAATRELAAAAANGRPARIEAGIDGIERIFTFRQIGDYPLYAGFGLATEPVYQRWRGNLLIYAAIAAPAGLFLLLTAWVALQRARREEESARQLRAEMDRRAVAEEQREQAEAALRQAQKLEAIGQLTGGIAHDFNNLLLVVSGNIELVLRQIKDSALAQHLQATLKAAERGHKLTQQLLTFARQRPLRTSLVRVRERLGEMAELVERTLRSDIHFKTEVDDDLWPVEVDDDQMQLALLNVIVNARDAMKHGGLITIKGRNVILPQPDIRAGDLAGDFVAISIADNGQGIAPEILPRVFEPFFTTKEIGRGSGLGLAQVYGFARQANGLATIDSAAGRGTIVTIYLPRAAEPPPPLAQPKRERAAQTAGPARVLIVEDEPAVAAVAAAALRLIGLQTMVVERAREALELLKSGERFDLVFSDVVMPDGMSGVDLAREIHKLLPEMPILLTTGYTKEEWDETHLDCDVLEKPYSVQALQDAIADLLPIGSVSLEPLKN